MTTGGYGCGAVAATVVATAVATVAAAVEQFFPTGSENVVRFEKQYPRLIQFPQGLCFLRAYLPAGRPPAPAFLKEF